MPNDNQMLPEKVVDYINVSSIALEKAAEVETAKEAQDAKVASLIPAAVQALIDGGRIREEQREKAASVLSDPVQAIEFITKVAAHRNLDEQTLGTPVDTQTKQAGAVSPGYDSINDCRPGLRTTMEKQSSVNFKQALGLS